MKILTPEISWHERDPIYSCAFNPTRTNVYGTAGVTGIIRLWELKCSCDSIVPSFIASLNRHTKAVNIIRWNYDGTILASAGDEGVILLWNENEVKNQKTLDMDDDEINKENWFAFKTLRGHIEDVLDLCWSRDGTILISGSVDNSAIVWDIATGNKKCILKEPKGFVQGVTYDPLGAYYAVLSTDRSLRYYSTSSNKCIFNVNKLTMNKDADNTVNARLFHDDTMKSFFRRLCFSHDGNLIFAPAGCLEIDDKIINVSYVFARSNLQKPCFYLPHDKPSVAIAVNPLKFQLMNENFENLFILSYRLIFAIATEDSIFFYDTQHQTPFAYVTGIHYSNLTDISWSQNGQLLSVTSIDGFCTFVSFNENELGLVYEAPKEVIENNIETKPILPTNQPKQESQNTVIKMFNNIKSQKNDNDNQKDDTKRRIKLTPL